ncbi:hypothetical protein BABINDRAFT_159541 [Babjeviella inositovora NRRL Y-12698]|uniref:Glutathione hydrolase n=1 Tax=Babjeviella inositovora NRRL Y-12698 TaxID=984486 RepID=A0A1E3QZI2_9ASCO|nr:uncharacterized protein BABINDRAFT_159541 [Babjeviella inositovora NRRL Y-12698]ODQ83080.1 hypothetical protein BABINDRAFT_159541 [Babjeviella inositovora NRRL Y-12698]
MSLDEKTSVSTLPSSRRHLRILATALLLVTLFTLTSIPLTSPFPPRPYPYVRSDPHLFGNPVANPITGDGPTWSPAARHMSSGHRGMVASDSELCSQMGSGILADGGSAADAAVTVALCIGVVNSFSSGIGGGGFIISKPYGAPAVSFDAREVAPQAAHRDMYKDHEHLSQFGGLAVAIPGELQGLYELYRMHTSGVLSWADLIAPVTALCHEGFVASNILEFAASRDSDVFFELKEYWGWIFRGDRLVREGEIVTRPELGKTLLLIAANGSSAIFYDPEGPIVPSLVELSRKFGGIITKDDFANYSVRIEPALETNYLDHAVYTTNGASSGPVLISGLNVLNGYGSQNNGDFSLVPSHRMIETFKYMAAVRSNLGDVVDWDHQEQKVRQERTAKFSTPEWAREVRHNISDSRTLPWQEYNSAYRVAENHGTASFSIVDSYNNSVAMTSTVNLLFGSMLHDPVTGVILNNEMDDFSIPDTTNAFGLKPVIYNFISPRRRPLSSMSPTIVTNSDGTPDLVIGAAGGSRITTAILQAIVRTYSYNLPLLETIAFPRLHHQLFPEEVYVEEPVSQEFIAGLEARGHKVSVIDHLTAMNGIRKAEDGWIGVSDWWRKRGCASGC